MAHRDDREAERARIESLERRVAEAEERATEAERAARAATERARATEARAESAAATAKEKEKRIREENAALRKKERRAKRADPTPLAAPSTHGWSPAARRRYRVASGLAAAASYASIALAQVANGGSELDRGALIAVPIAAAADVGLHLVIGRATGAPDPFAGAWITLIAGAMSIGALLLLGSGALFDDVLPAVLVVPARAIGTLAAIGIGAGVTAAWSSDAAGT